MFHLAGYSDIEASISRAQEGRTNRLTNLLKNVSEESTKYLHRVWKDYKKVCFELRLNGEQIDIHIKDSENFYSCEQRSDGFKRFVTFLLALSARVNSEEISNSIIVVDEPDLGIHILGQKNLVQELVKMSKNNLVFYSTHSIFMIDKREISRHFMVRKNNEITTIKQATESSYTDDEVLFNALGYSIFETLKPQNIIFEGWSDKKVFECAIETTKGKKNSNLKNIGTVHSTGVKDIAGISKFLVLANREYCIISDSDDVAAENKKKYLTQKQDENVWYMYSDMIEGIHTLEDFIKHSVLNGIIEQVQKNHSELKSFNYEAFQTQIYRREEFIVNWIKSAITEKATIDLIRREMKNTLYSNLKGRDIEDSYYDFLSSLDKKLAQT